MAIGDHIRTTIGQLEMQGKLPTDRRNFDTSGEANLTAIQRLSSDAGSLSYGADNQRSFDVNLSYKRPMNRKNNQPIVGYELENSGSSSYVSPGCQPFHNNLKSKRNLMIIIIVLSIFCVSLIAAVIILAVKSGSTEESAQKVEQRSSNGRVSLTKTMKGSVRPGQLIFDDDFEEFDESVWRHDRYLSTDGFVLYGSSRNNSYVEDGILFIEPTFTANHFNESFLTSGKLIVGETIEKSCSSFYRSQCEKVADRYKILNPIMSASIRTSQSFTFQYGILEMRAKMPTGDWISTEISLLPRYEYYGEPADTSKIVLITTRGNMDYFSLNQTHFGQERFCSQLIYSDSRSNVRSSMIQHCQNAAPGNGFGMNFHVYKFEWNPDMLKVFVDDRLVGKFIANTVVPAGVRHIVVAGDQEEDPDNGSFNQQFYINMKVGVGVGFPDQGVYPRSNGMAKPWRNDEPERAPFRFWTGRRQWERSWLNRSAALQVDYIRVHAL